MHQTKVEKPFKRSKIRKILGKEYFILKRQWNWLAGSQKFAKVNTALSFNHQIIAHKSLLLRPLKDVEMYLQHNKVTNLRIAIAKINQVVIHPGETFSIWKMVGRTSKRKGYLMGMTLHNGQIQKDTGGGLCQLGNLLYWMALHSPLTVTERWRHSYDVFPDVNRTIPFACGATLSYNYIDLQLKNNTAYSFQINLSIDDNYLHGKLTSNESPAFSYAIEETDHHFQQQIWGGYTRHNRIWKRSTSLKTGETKSELIAENHAIMMYSPLIDK